MKRYIGSLLCLFLLCLTACVGDPYETNHSTTGTTRGSIITTSTSGSTDIVTTITEEETTSKIPVNESSITTRETNAETTTKTTATNTTTTTTTNTTTTTTTTNTTTTTTTVTTQTTLATPSGELRAAWASYIELDSLFRSCSTAAQAKQAIDGILDTMEEFNLNTLYFHVRANSDAYYQSLYFKPAASVKRLLGIGFDPLSYAVEAAHKRGIALHAWINPYRAGKDESYLVSEIPTLTDSAARYYYVPTSAKAQQLILNGIRELVNNYAIDGIQYDDYFYPSGVLGETTVYSYESADYEAYRNSGGSLSIADWRRAAVDTLIAGTHIITESQNRIFGVSPAVNAQNTYDTLYANPQKWMAESGYIDYICPQIYTGFKHSGSAFDTMTDEWMSYPRHSSVELHVGIATYKAGLLSDTWAGNGQTEWATNEDILKRSVLYLRSKGIRGMAFYSYSYLTPDKVAGLSSTNDVTVARKEIENLRTVL